MADVYPGKVIGFWTLIEKSGEEYRWKWLCRCECGSERYVATIQLIRGNSRSCGCKRMQYDLTGQEFGKWSVISYKQQSRGDDSTYLCRCECGQERYVKSPDLRNGKSTNCGCANRVPNGTVPLKAIEHTYKATAKRRGVEWNLTQVQFMTLIAQDCTYCGCKPFQYRSYRGYAGAFYMGIDRVDSTHGYTWKNVVPCCKFCNIAKMARPQEEFKEWVRVVYKNWASK